MSFRNIVVAITLGVGLAGIASAQCTCCSGANKDETVMSAKTVKGVQKITVVIDGGYAPSTITAKVGKPLAITFYRKEKSGCGNQVVFKSLGIKKDVANGARVTVKFTPKKAGIIKFTCGMGMYKGQIVVK